MPQTARKGAAFDHPGENAGHAHPTRETHFHFPSQSVSLMALEFEMPKCQCLSIRTVAVAFSWLNRLAPVIAVLAIAEMGYVLHTNRLLGQKYQALADLQAGQLSVSVGDEITAVTGADAGGRRVIISLGEGRRSLVAGISSTCPACNASVETLRRLAAMAQSRGMRVVFVSRDPLPLASRSPIQASAGIDVVFEPTHTTYANVKLNRVPQTLIVDSQGRVRTVVIGQLDQRGERRLTAEISK